MDNIDQQTEKYEFLHFLQSYLLFIVATLQKSNRFITNVGVGSKMSLYSGDPPPFDQNFLCTDFERKFPKCWTTNGICESSGLVHHYRSDLKYVHQQRMVKKPQLSMSYCLHVHNTVSYVYDMTHYICCSTIQQLTSHKGLVSHLGHVQMSMKTSQLAICSCP